MPGAAAALRMVSTSVSMLMGYLYVGGHVQNETLVAEYSGMMGTRTVSIDARAGTACVGEACHEECLWWSPEIGNDTDTVCDPYVTRRLLSKERLDRSLQRATRCAMRGSEVCVLSHEVGLELPGAFVWNTTESRMRLFLMPRTHVAKEAQVKRIALFAPGSRATEGDDHATIMNLAQEVLVEHYDAWTHELRSDTVREDAAYCMQLLRSSVPEECADAMPMEAPLRGYDERV